MALALAIQIPLAYVMISQPISPAKFGNYALHKSLGLTVFCITVIRLIWRLFERRRLQPAMPKLMGALARASHASLYLLTLSMPLTGWLSSSAANFPVSFFGLFTLPDLVEPSKPLHDLLEATHRWLAYCLFALAATHIAAALWHHIRLRDGVLAGMIPWLKRRRTTKHDSHAG